MEIKPCPFCNKPMQNNNFFSIDSYPKACGCWEKTQTTQEAVDVWNTRPIEDALRNRIAELEHDIAELEQADDEADKMIGDYKYRIERLLHLEQPRWIPVSERLPEEKQLVWLYTDTAKFYAGWLDWSSQTENYFTVYATESKAYHTVNVTHWQLPLPPEVK